jgi:hypothetical protein
LRESGAALAAESAALVGVAADSTPLLLQEVVIAAAMTMTVNNCFMEKVFYEFLMVAKLPFLSTFS